MKRGCAVSRKGYDSVNIASIPQDDTAILLGYVDGKWPTWSALRNSRPNPIILSIATSSLHTAQMLDVEWGDATKVEAPPWTMMMRHLGSEPINYCSAGGGPNEPGPWLDLRNEYRRQGIREPLYAIANYNLGQISEIPGEYVAAGCIGVQYRSDTSQDLDYWVFSDIIPGIDPSPKGEDMDRQGLITMAFGLLAARDPSLDELNRLSDTTNVTDRQVVLAALDSSDGVAVKNSRRIQAGLH